MFDNGHPAGCLVDIQWVLDLVLILGNHCSNRIMTLLVEDGIFKPGATDVFDPKLFHHINLVWFKP